MYRRTTALEAIGSSLDSTMKPLVTPAKFHPRSLRAPSIAPRLSREVLAKFLEKNSSDAKNCSPPLCSEKKCKEKEPQTGSLEGGKKTVGGTAVWSLGTMKGTLSKEYIIYIALYIIYIATHTDKYFLNLTKSNEV